MTPPPSREPGQAGVTDAESWRRWYSRVSDDAVSMTGNELWQILDAADTAQADRTRNQERIVELKERLAMRSITAHFLLKADACDWHVCELEPCVSDRALLEEVQDAKPE